MLVVDCNPMPLFMRSGNQVHSYAHLLGCCTAWVHVLPIAAWLLVASVQYTICLSRNSLLQGLLCLSFNCICDVAGPNACSRLRKGRPGVAYTACRPGKQSRHQAVHMSICHGISKAGSAVAMAFAGPLFQRPVLMVHTW